MRLSIMLDCWKKNCQAATVVTTNVLVLSASVQDGRISHSDNSSSETDDVYSALTACCGRRQRYLVLRPDNVVASLEVAGQGECEGQHGIVPAVGVERRGAYQHGTRWCKHVWRRGKCTCQIRRISRGFGRVGANQMDTQYLACGFGGIRGRSRLGAPGDFERVARIEGLLWWQDEQGQGIGLMDGSRERSLWHLRSAGYCCAQCRAGG